MWCTLPFQIPGGMTQMYGKYGANLAITTKQDNACTIIITSYIHVQSHMEFSCSLIQCAKTAQGAQRYSYIAYI